MTSFCEQQTQTTKREYIWMFIKLHYRGTFTIEIYTNIHTLNIDANARKAWREREREREIRCLLYADDLVLLSHSTWFTAEPGPAGATLQDLGPDSHPEENQHYNISEKIQIPGNTTHIYIRH